MNDLTQKVIQLRKLNFADIIHIDYPNIEDYDFDCYINAQNRHHPIKGFCVSCEKQNCNTSPNEPDFRLKYISHGAHTIDFNASLHKPMDISTWHQEAIMFVYESPSIDWGDGIYEEHQYEGFFKNPSKEWYWIHCKNNPVKYPKEFSGGKYGSFVLSALLTFRLANVYVTNLVKCGLNDDKNHFRGISHYNAACIKNCFATMLKREIDIHQPAVIFAVGSTVEWWLKQFLPKDTFIQQLPHPAGRRRGFRDDHYKVLYFWLIVQALHKAGILKEEEISTLAKQFLNNYSLK